MRREEREGEKAYVMLLAVLVGELCAARAHVLLEEGVDNEFLKMGYNEQPRKITEA